MSKNKEELHLFIVWHNAKKYTNQILNDLSQNFLLRNVFSINWSRNKNVSLNNMLRFYGLTEDEGSKNFLANNKGVGTFTLAVVVDSKPSYKNRKTSKGIKLVNINTFDAKTRFRVLSKGIDQIHATNNQTETNHDLKLLFGLGIEDFKAKYPVGKNEEINDVGLYADNGFDSFTDMFNFMNGLCNYCVMRNFEGLEKNIVNKQHTDVDIMCDDEKQLSILLNAKKTFINPNRCQYRVYIQGKEIFLDLRDINNNYYCQNMANDMLKNRLTNQYGIYIPNEEMYFYSLFISYFHNKTPMLFNFWGSLQSYSFSF